MDRFVKEVGYRRECPRTTASLPVLLHAAIRTLSPLAGSRNVFPVTPVSKMAFNAGPRLIVGRRVGLLKLHGIDPQRGGIKIPGHSDPVRHQPRRNHSQAALNVMENRCHCVPTLTHLVFVALAFTHHDTGGYVRA